MPAPKDVRGIACTVATNLWVDYQYRMKKQGKKPVGHRFFIEAVSRLSEWTCRLTQFAIEGGHADCGKPVRISMYYGATDANAVGAGRVMKSYKRHTDLCLPKLIANIPEGRTFLEVLGACWAYAANNGLSEAEQYARGSEIIKNVLKAQSGFTTLVVTFNRINNLDQFVENFAKNS